MSYGRRGQEGGRPRGNFRGQPRGRSRFQRRIYNRGHERGPFNNSLFVRRPLDDMDQFFSQPLCLCESVEPEPQTEYDVPGEWMTYGGEYYPTIFEDAAHRAHTELQRELNAAAKMYAAAKKSLSSAQQQQPEVRPSTSWQDEAASSSPWQDEAASTAPVLHEAWQDEAASSAPVLHEAWQDEAASIAPVQHEAWKDEAASSTPVVQEAWQDEAASSAPVVHMSWVDEAASSVSGLHDACDNGAASSAQVIDEVSDDESASSTPGPDEVCDDEAASSAPVLDEDWDDEAFSSASGQEEDSEEEPHTGIIILTLEERSAIQQLANAYREKERANEKATAARHAVQAAYASGSRLAPQLALTSAFVTQRATNAQLAFEAANEKVELAIQSATGESPAVSKKNNPEKYAIKTAAQAARADYMARALKSVTITAHFDGKGFAKPLTIDAAVSKKRATTATYIAQGAAEVTHFAQDAAKAAKATKPARRAAAAVQAQEASAKSKAVLEAKLSDKGKRVSYRVGKNEH